MRGQPQNQNSHSQVHVSSKGKGLRVEKKQPISKEKFEVVKKDQNLQQVVELKIEDWRYHLSKVWWRFYWEYCGRSNYGYTW